MVPEVGPVQSGEAEGSQGVGRQTSYDLGLTINYCHNLVLFSLVCHHSGSSSAGGEREVCGVKCAHGGESGYMWNWFGRYTVHLRSELQGLNFLKFKNIARMS